MTSLLNNLIDSLRDELQQYGEMLARLDSQQEHIFQRAVDNLPRSFAEISAQAGIIRAARQKREDLRAKMAREIGLGEEAQFTDIVALLPPDYRPLLRALVEENNQLLVRIQQRARQNHLLLIRSVELMVNFMSGLFPAAQPAVYGASGLTPSQAAAPYALYDATG
jgi:flagellar biosynthesis/type III secretory pathway chaperone